MNEKLLLQDLVVLLAKKSGITQKEADKFFRELFQLVLEGIYDNDIVKIKDFGTFKLVKVNSRESVDVNTGNKIEIPAHYKMSFTPDKTLKELVNEPFAHFESVPLDEDERTFTDNDTPKAAVDKSPVTTEPDREDDVEEFILEEDEEDNVEDELLDMESDMELESGADVQSGGLLDDFSFLSEEPKASTSETGHKDEIIPEAKKPEDRAVAEKDNDTKPHEEKPKRKIGLIDLIDVNSLPKRTIKLDEKKEKTSAPPLLDLIDVKRERKVVEAKTEKVELNPEPEKVASAEKVVAADKRTNLEDTVISKKIIEDAVDIKEVETREIAVEKSQNEEIAADKDITEKVEVSQPAVPQEETIKPKNQIPPVVGESRKQEIKGTNTVESRNVSPYVPEHSEDDDDDFDYGYVDYEKLARESKWKKKLPVIIVSLVVLIFAIYQFAKLFDVTYDYEYYINHVPPLSLSDSLPLIDEQPARVNPASVDSLTSAVDNNRMNRAGTEVNPLTNEQISANIDELTRQLKSANGVERKSINISERLQIKVTNKAEVFFSQR